MKTLLAALIVLALPAAAKHGRPGAPAPEASRLSGAFTPAGDCPFLVVGRQGQTLGRLPASHPACAGARAMEADYRRLLDAAGLEYAQAPLSIADTCVQTECPDAMATYFPQTGRVAVDIELMRRFGDRPVVWRGILAHELAHTLQHVLGLAICGGWGQVPCEGHADAVGAEILERAGFGADAMRRSIEAFAGREAILNRNLHSIGHPDAGVRWRNAVSAEAAIAAVAEGRGFDGAIRPRAGEPFRPIANILDITADGAYHGGGSVRRALLTPPPAPGPEQLVVRRAGPPPAGTRVTRYWYVPGVPVLEDWLLSLERRTPAADHPALRRAVAEAAARVDSFSAGTDAAYAFTERMVGAASVPQTLWGAARLAAERAARRLSGTP